MKGKLIGISVGPGDTELLTLKALKYINQVDNLAYLCNDEKKSMAYNIVKPVIEKQHNHLPIKMPMVMDSSVSQKIYRESAKQIANILDLGQDVGFLCEGDSMLYGSFMYLFEILKNNYEIVVIPGVSSILASASQMQMPLASRNETLHIIPATLEKNILKSKIENADSFVIMKITRNFDKVFEILKNLNLIENCKLIQHATTDKEKIFNLKDITEKQPYFSLIIGKK